MANLPAKFVDELTAEFQGVYLARSTLTEENLHSGVLQAKLMPKLGLLVAIIPYSMSLTRR